MPTLQFVNEDARIVALAVAYHLGRPGSETDPDTLKRHSIGLASVDAMLTPFLGQARIDLDLTPYQIHRLDEALLGVTNELKAYEMAERRSTVLGFGDRLSGLFPELAAGSAEDASALDLVERVVMLRRRLTSSVREANASLQAECDAAAEAAAAAKQARRWWQFWR